MNRKKIILGIVVLVVLTAVVFSVMNVSQKKKTAVKEESKKEEKQVTEKKEEKAEEVDKKEAVDMSDWKTYRDEKYGFEIKYPDDWKLEMESSNPNDLSRKDSFIFQKGEKQYFAVFTNGGFGHGMADPVKTSEEYLDSKKAKMFWYDYPFPSYIYIIDNLPSNWGVENFIELRLEEDDPDSVREMKMIFDSFKFLNGENN